MKLISRKANLSGSVLIPSSKSHTVRALLFSLMGEGISTITNPLESGDTDAALSVVRAFGGEIKGHKDGWCVTGRGGLLAAPDDVVNVLNSGTTLYIAMGIAGLIANHTVFTGDEQIRNRPAGNLIKALNSLGATSFSTRGNGCAPLVVGGRLKGGKISIECPTSQFLTSLLMACPAAEGDTEINVPLLYEKPYVHMTLDWLNHLNLKVDAADDLSCFRIKGGQHFPHFTRRMPGDFSTATFFLCAAAITGDELILEGLDMKDAQGDKAVIDYLRAMGATIELREEGIYVRGGQLRGCELDLNATPDALPAMAVAACFASGKTRLVNVPQARLKETDRLAVMNRELSALGARITELEDGLVIEESRLLGGSVSGHADHRVVMSLALAGLRSKTPVTVDTAEALAVTCPGFVKLMNAIGADLELIPDE